MAEACNVVPDNMVIEADMFYSFSYILIGFILQEHFQVLHYDVNFETSTKKNKNCSLETIRLDNSIWDTQIILLNIKKIPVVSAW